MGLTAAGLRPPEPALQAGMLRGTTLWIDFPFPAFPENMVSLAAPLAAHCEALTGDSAEAPRCCGMRKWVHAAGARPQCAPGPTAAASRRTLLAAGCLQGHWAEVLAPVYSALTEGAWKERAPEADGFINALLFPNLRRSQVQVRATWWGARSGMPGWLWPRHKMQDCRRGTSLQLLLRGSHCHTTLHPPPWQGLIWVMDMLRLLCMPSLPFTATLRCTHRLRRASFGSWTCCGSRCAPACPRPAPCPACCSPTSWSLWTPRPGWRWSASCWCTRGA